MYCHLNRHILNFIFIFKYNYLIGMIITQMRGTIIFTLFNVFKIRQVLLKDKDMEYLQMKFMLYVDLDLVWHPLNSWLKINKNIFNKFFKLIFCIADWAGFRLLRFVLWSKWSDKPAYFFLRLESHPMVKTNYTNSCLW